MSRNYIARIVFISFKLLYKLMLELSYHFGYVNRFVKILNFSKEFAEYVASGGKTFV